MTSEANTMELLKTGTFSTGWEPLLLRMANHIQENGNQDQLQPMLKKFKTWKMNGRLGKHSNNNSFN